MVKPKVLILIDYYIPGYKSGGPARSVAYIIEHLGEELDFRVLTRDRDVTDVVPYPTITSDYWNRCGQGQVYYASALGFALIRQIINDVAPDVVYLNSYFSPFPSRYLVLRRFGLVPETSVILAPRGEFSPGALKLKSFKKKTYIALASFAGLYRNLIWQASSEQEKLEIEAALPGNHLIHVAPNMPPRAFNNSNNSAPKKSPGSAHFIFLSRISPKKNIVMALQFLKHLHGEILFSIIGPIRDEKYWKQCEEAMKSLPRNVKVEYLGPMPHPQAQEALQQSHFFLLPTLGENFGHAILEALKAGRPVLISDQTPWHYLAQKGIGWDLPLASEREWLSALQACVDMDQIEYDGMSINARNYATDWITGSDIRNANLELFYSASKRNR